VYYTCNRTVTSLLKHLSSSTCRQNGTIDAISKSYIKVERSDDLSRATMTVVSQPFESPTSRMLNDLLFGDWGSGSFGGIISRSLDDDVVIPTNISTAVQRSKNVTSTPNQPRYLYYPTSFMHASIRAATSFYYPGSQMSPSCCIILVGSRYRLNQPVPR
jgi:hypothetical protein